MQHISRQEAMRLLTEKTLSPTSLIADMEDGAFLVLFQQYAIGPFHFPTVAEQVGTLFDEGVSIEHISAMLGAGAEDGALPN